MDILNNDVKTTGSEAEMLTACSVKEQKEICDYTKYPREFLTYRWYKPIAVFALASIIQVFFSAVLTVIAVAVEGGDLSTINEIAYGGYDNFNAYSTAGALVTLGTAATFIPAIALANMIAGGRTFKSYESSRGGWNYRIFFKSMLLALVISALPITIDNIFFTGKIDVNQFSVLGFILCTVFGPMQCIAEEYQFRGLIMQAFGSWFKIPLLAVALQAAVFASLHPYDAIGVAEIAVSGIVMGLIAWISHGLEASSALHIANNMAIFYTVGFGYGKISSTSTWHDFILSVSIDIVFLIAVIICRKKGMYEDVICDDAAEYNKRVGEKTLLKEFKQFLKQQENPESAEADATYAGNTDNSDQLHLE